MPKNTVKLDKERELRYPFPAILALQEECNINLMQPATYTGFSPVQVRDLVWAGQLHTAKPLTRAQVGRYLPADTDAFMGVIETIAKAVGAALGNKSDDTP